MSETPVWQPGCPVEVTPASDRIRLSHGEGARDSRRLIRDHILPRFGITEDFRDAALLSATNARLAISTDSHTVWPLFFPGGDIGSLAVYGTVNDLAVSGARPRWMTVALILEEGFPIDVLLAVLDRLAAAARECEVQLVAGDTKVVPRGAVDGLMINTTSVGELRDPLPPGPSAIQNGDQLIVSGPLGRHGTAVLCAREELGFATAPESDAGSVFAAVDELLNAVGPGVRCLRDATRGGVSSVLQEWTADCGLSFRLQQAAVPVSDDVRGACELLGLDPLYVANEGTFVAAVAADAVGDALSILQALPGTGEAAVIGDAIPRGISAVLVERLPGTRQPLDEPSGAPLPRIC